ncbi:MAG TPA: hypothetical protein PKB06_02720 [Actinotalea sp.]|nr:hypothetical protein [Actinotalea sp.]
MDPDGHAGDDAAAALLAHAGRLTGWTLTAPEALGGSGRSLVLRCRTGTTGAPGMTGAPGAPGPATVVVKRFGDAFAAEYARERTGLRTLGGTPELLASDDPTLTLVMSDLGEHPTLADLLLGSARAEAWAGAVGWAEALGDLLGAGHAAAPGLAGELRPDRDELTSVLRRGLDRLVEVGADEDGAREERRRPAAAETQDLLAWLTAPVPRRAVVSPGDTCPDNALLTPHGWRFLDLEGTCVQDAAVDAAYAVLPFATCWCVYDPPTDLTTQMLDALSGALGRHVDLGPDWQHDVLRACAAFVLASSGWMWPGALEDRQVGGTEVRSPRHRELLTARWRWGAAHLATVTPAIAGLCADADAWAVQAWGGRTPGPYPVFG